jgi:alkylglycerol monooxygenase
LMAAQAIGRATVVRDPAAVAVAVGAGLFMLSDALLAINRFAQPLPMAQLWVLATYYAAQVLIVRNSVGGARQALSHPSAVPRRPEPASSHTAAGAR